MLYYCSFANAKAGKAGGGLKELFSNDPAAIEAFVKRWDKPGRGVYRCVNPLKPGATVRRIETVAAIERVHLDIDFKDLEESEEEIDAKLLQFGLEPTAVYRSGGGRHLIWELI
jgi:hypothetical protein